MFYYKNDKVFLLSRADNVSSGNFLHRAVLSKRSTPKFIRKIVRDQPDLLNGCNASKCTPLHLAVYHCPRINIIHELLLRGADVNAKNDQSQTPLDLTVIKYVQDLCLTMQNLFYYDVRMDEINWDSFLLENENINESSILSLLGEEVCKADVIALKQSLNNMPKYITVMKLLLEYGATPNCGLFKLIRELQIFSSTERVSKLLLQYLIINNLKRSLSCLKMKNSCFHHYEFLDDDLEDLQLFSCIEYSSELLTFRNNLVDELIDMMGVEIDENSTLFSYIYEHCSNRMSFKKTELSFLFKILSVFHRKSYTCCYDLIDASLKRDDLLSHFYKLDIYAKKSSYENFHVNERVTFHEIVLWHMAKYLLKEDIINLLVAYCKNLKPEKQLLLKEHYKNESTIKHDVPINRVMSLFKLENSLLNLMVLNEEFDYLWTEE